MIAKTITPGKISYARKKARKHGTPLPEYAKYKYRKGEALVARKNPTKSDRQYARIFCQRHGLEVPEWAKTIKTERRANPTVKPKNVSSTAKSKCRKYCAEHGIAVPDWATRIRVQGSKRHAEKKKAWRYAPIRAGRTPYGLSLVYTDLVLWGGRQEYEFYRMRAARNSTCLNDSALVSYIAAGNFELAFARWNTLKTTIAPNWGSNPHLTEKKKKEPSGKEDKARLKEADRVRRHERSEKWKKFIQENKVAYGRGERNISDATGKSAGM